MRNLLRFIIQYHFPILFLLIESFSLFLLINSNSYQRVRFYAISHGYISRISQRIENYKDYLSLRDENRKLAEENTQLYNKLKSSYRLGALDTVAVRDSVNAKKYLYINARVINNTVNKQFNYITLDKGLKNGIRPEMAVISSEGIVGTVKSVSDNYAAVLSLLNRNFIVSGKIKKNNYFGPVSWNGNLTGHVTMVDIPHHVKISKGDTIITSGYGGIFPEGYLIGVIDNYHLKGGNYYEISVRLSSDFRKLNSVQVIKNFTKPEIDSLENFVNQ
jgi:rod shape-determining protein MreC